MLQIIIRKEKITASAPAVSFNIKGQSHHRIEQERERLAIQIEQRLLNPRCLYPIDGLDVEAFILIFPSAGVNKRKAAGPDEER